MHPILTRVTAVQVLFWKGALKQGVDEKEITELRNALQTGTPLGYD